VTGHQPSRQCSHSNFCTGGPKCPVTLNGHALSIPAIHAADGFAKAWLIEIDGSCWPTFLVVEADTVSIAIGDE